MSVTLRDVAKRCGLSPSTVSGILNNRSTTWASAATRRRVLETAASLGYRPNQAARALRTGKTSVVTLLYHVEPPLQHATFDAAAEIIATHLGQRGYVLNLHVYPDQARLMDGLLDLVKRHTCDAVVLVGREADVIEQGELLEEHDFPFVVKGRHESAFPHWYQVDYDHEGMMREAIRHLHRQGHRRIAYIGYQPGEAYQSHLLVGFRKGIQEIVGVEPNPAHLALVDALARPRATDALLRWLDPRTPEPPTAVVIGTGPEDWREIERLLAIRRRFIGDAPGNIAVVGQAERDFRLAYGTAWRFADVSYVSIAEVIVHELLLPLLRHDPVTQTIRRILPELVPVPSLDLPRR